MAYSLHIDLGFRPAFCPDVSPMGPGLTVGWRHNRPPSTARKPCARDCMAARAVFQARRVAALVSSFSSICADAFPFARHVPPPYFLERRAGGWWVLVCGV
jgi:hypothetical protein